MSTTGTAMYSVVTKIDTVVIEQVETIPLPSGKIEKIDLTNQDSGFGKEFTTGRFDPGDVTIKGIWTTGKTGIEALRTASNDRALHAMEIDLPDGTVISFNAYIGTFRIVEDKEKASYEVDLTISGIPTIRTTTTALTTPFFAITDAGSTSITDITPAPSATTGNYVVKMATDDTGVKVTPTCGTASSTIYVNDTVVASGAASSAITLGSAGSITNVTIKVVTTGKADAYYKLIVVRPSA